MKTIHTFAERDAKIAGLHHVVAELNIQVAALNQAIVESDVQIVNLERAEAECREEISSLTQTLSENEREISDARQQLMVATDRYIAVMNSNSMKLTAFARTFRRTIAQGAYLCAAFMRAARSHGVRHAISKAKTYIEREADRPESASEIAVSNQEQYLIRKSVQNGYLTNYLAVGLDASHSELIREQFAVRVTESRKLVIYPLSYSMSLTQRPDHILRNFSESGYWCIVISIDDNPPFIKEISNNIFLTNLFAAVISYFSRSEIVFYITYPFFSYIINHLQKPIVVYDVLDDLSVFSSPCEAMTADHKKLLERADVTLFSSQELFDANRDDVRGHAALVSNGVWAKDFVVDPENAHRKVNFKKYPDEFVIGYHGAITELLDWGLLEQLIQIPRVRLVLVGPVAHFDNVDADISRATQERVLAADQVTHVKTVPYVDLKYYLSGFDAGIVPFVVNEKTHPVSPLKLFEYMAIGLMVFATPTRTLSRYSQFICVDDRAILPERVRAFVNGASNSFAMADYSSVLMDADWGRQLELVISVLEDKKTNSKRSFRKLKTVDITNINFFDWDGVNLYKGGAERYVYDLACMLKDEGWAPRLIQNANRAFECDFRGISVVGVQTDSGHNLRGMSKKFRDECCDADLIIASPADLACEMRGLNVVGINHGIYWDHKFKKLENSNANEYINIFDAIKISSSVVAVDTNFINWVRTYDHGLGSKITYIPNYVDSSHFMPTQKDFEGKIRILYPRRLYEARGIFITLKAFDYLFERHDNIELHLVGQSDSKDEKVVSEFIGKHCGRVLWEELDMDEMPKAYQASHIVLVPTMYSEGTSLSCLEAMATNNVVVATNVGGLPNLVVDGFNGLLISPTVEELIRSIETLLVNRGLMQSMATKGVELSAAFRKERWLARWRSVISDTVK
jgi:glycosyltransferase involved in cell wall biosynthesis